MFWSFSISRKTGHSQFYILDCTESFCIFQMKIHNDIFLQNIFTIYNQLYHVRYLQLPSPNVSLAFHFRPCKNFLVFIQNMLLDRILDLFKCFKFLVI